MSDKKEYEIIEIIKKKRIELGYSQEYMADKLGISQSSYSRKENGTEKMSVVELSKIVDILGMSLSLSDSEGKFDRGSVKKTDNELIRLELEIVNMRLILNEIARDIEKMKRIFENLTKQEYIPSFKDYQKQQEVYNNIISSKVVGWNEIEDFIRNNSDVIKKYMRENKISNRILEYYLD